VRFSLTRREGDSLYLSYVLERDHHPFAHGSLEYSLHSTGFVQPPAEETVRRQGEAYVASYLRWSARAAAR
jgi:hypothetical protein